MIALNSAWLVFGICGYREDDIFVPAVAKEEQVRPIYNLLNVSNMLIAGILRR